MPKSKPPRTRLRRTSRNPKLDAAYRGVIAACEQNVALIQRTMRDVESVAHHAPVEELESFRQEMEEGVRCWTSVRNMHLDAMQRPREPSWPGIEKALKRAGITKLKRR